MGHPSKWWTSSSLWLLYASILLYLFTKEQSFPNDSPLSVYPFSMNSWIELLLQRIMRPLKIMFSFMDNPFISMIASSTLNISMWFISIVYSIRTRMKFLVEGDVHYYCEQRNEWPLTRAGRTARVACPSSTQRYKERYCNSKGKWETVVDACPSFQCPVMTKPVRVTYVHDQPSKDTFVTITNSEEKEEEITLRTTSGASTTHTFVCLHPNTIYTVHMTEYVFSMDTEFE